MTTRDIGQIMTIRDIGQIMTTRDIKTPQILLFYYTPWPDINLILLTY